MKESTAKHVVNMRAKRSDQRWSVPGLRAVLNLRAARERPTGPVLDCLLAPLRRLARRGSTHWPALNTGGMRKEPMISRRLVSPSRVYDKLAA